LECRNARPAQDFFITKCVIARPDPDLLTAAGETLADTHYWATSFAGGAGDDAIMGGGEPRWRIRAANDAKHAIPPEWRIAA
jgi:hypothetical protein